MAAMGGESCWVEEKEDFGPANVINAGSASPLMRSVAHSNYWLSRLSTFHTPALSLLHTDAHSTCTNGSLADIFFSNLAPAPEQTDSPAHCVSTALKGPLYPKWRKLFHPNLISSSVAALAKQYFNIIKECAIVCNLNLPLCAGSQVLTLPRNEILSGNSWWLCCVRKQGHLEFERCTGCLRGDSTHTDTHVHGT